MNINLEEPGFIVNINYGLNTAMTETDFAAI